MRDVSTALSTDGSLWVNWTAAIWAEATEGQQKRTQQDQWPQQEAKTAPHAGVIALAVGDETTQNRRRRPDGNKQDGPNH